MQNIGAVEDDVEVDESANKEKVSRCEQRHEERLVFFDLADVGEQITQEINPDRCRRASSGNSRDGKACGKADRAERDQDRARVDLPAVEMLGEDGAYGRAEDDGGESSQFNNAVSPRKLL